MNPIEVVVKSSGKCVGHICPQCKTLHPKDAYASEQACKFPSKDRAEHCCQTGKCTDCGNVTEFYDVTRCDECHTKMWDARHLVEQAEAFEKADKIHVNDWLGPVFWPGRDGDSGFFDSVGSLLDACEDDDCDPPAFVWGSTEKRLTLDADGIVEAALEDHHEGAGVEPSAIEKLQVMLDEWCAEQRVKSYEEDQSVAVILRGLGSPSAL